jgi:DNA-binding response OmpR family regulator
MPRPRLAVVEDDQDLLASLLDYLDYLAYPVWGATSAEAFYKQLHTRPADILILDLGLPGEDGLQVAAHVRRLPPLATIIVSARDGLQDRLDGLTAGADRYLIKPVDLRELVANIEALWRQRCCPAPPPCATAPWRLAAGASRLYTPDGQIIPLTRYEWRLLQTLAATREVVERQALIAGVFGRQATNGSGRLDVLLTRLRRKIRLKTGRSLPLQTAHGVGYVLSETLEVAPAPPAPASGGP